MPPKPKITKEMILETVLEITRKTGFETVNARNIANQLECSTRPIFTCYKNMDELKHDFLNFAFDFYSQYVDNYSHTTNKTTCLVLPLSYIEFAKEETHIFKLLFISDMDLNMTEEKDFYKEIGNEKKAKIFSDTIGIELEQAKLIFLDLFLYSHGLAVLVATKKITLNKSTIEKMITDLLIALVRQEKPSWNLTD